MEDNSLFVPKHFSFLFFNLFCLLSSADKSEQGNVINPIKHLIYGASDIRVLLHWSEKLTG